MTVLEVIQKSSDFLAKKGVDSPRLQAELLLSHVLQLPRMQLYLNFERELKPAESDALRSLVKRRGRREPLQHILGSVSFCGIEISVNRHVLVPRPESELLAEAGWSFLAGRDPKPSTVLDFGTGSGCIAIVLATKCPAVSVLALDISPAATEVAKRNVARHDLSGRVRCVTGDGLMSLPAGSCFDLIISNPPYIASREIGMLEPEVRDNDPRVALDGGADGLEFYRRFASEATPFVNPGGRIMLEFGDGQSGPIRGMFEEQKWIVEGVREDYTRRPRILVARRE